MSSSSTPQPSPHDVLTQLIALHLAKGAAHASPASDAHPEDVASFVADATEVLSLETLRLALGARIAAVKGDLVAAINRDYSIFVGLSAALDGSDNSVLRLRAPLARAAEQLGAVSAATEARRREVGAAARELRAARAIAAAAEAVAAAEDAAAAAARLVERATLAGSSNGGGAGAGGMGCTAGAVEDGGEEFAVDLEGALDAWEGRHGGGAIGASGGSGDGAALMLAEASAPGGVSATALSTSALVTPLDGVLRSSDFAARAWASSIEGGGCALVQAHLLLRAAGLVRAAAALLNAAAAAAATTRAEAGEGMRVIGGEQPPTPSDDDAQVLTRLRHVLVADVCAGSLEPALKAATAAALEAVASAPLPSAATPHSSGAGLLHGKHLVLHLCLRAWSVAGGTESSSGTAVALAGPAQTLCASLVTRPLLLRLMTQARLDEGGARGSYKGASRVLDELLISVSTAGEWLRSGTTSSASSTSTPLAGLAGVLCCASGVPGFSPVGALLWAPLVDHIASALPSFFSPALPAVFHANYTALSAFFSRLRVAASGLPLEPPLPLLGLKVASGAAVATSPTPAALTDGAASPMPVLSASESLLQHASSVALAAVWRPKLGVYATLRSQEAGQRVEKALTGARLGLVDVAPGCQATRVALAEMLHAGGGGGSGWGSPAAVHAALLHVVSATGSRGGVVLPPLPPPSVCFFLTTATPAVWNAIVGAWAPGTSFLPPLLPPTLALSLQLLSRYSAWVAAGTALAAARSGAAPHVLARLLSFSSSAPSPPSGVHASSPTVGGLEDPIAASLAQPPPPPVTQQQPQQHSSLLALDSLPPVFTRSFTLASITAALAATHAAPGSSTPTTPVPTAATVGGGAAMAASVPLPPLQVPQLPPLQPDLNSWLDAVGGGGQHAAPGARMGSASPAVGTPGGGVTPGAGNSAGAGACSIEALLGAAHDLYALADAAGALVASRALAGAGLEPPVVGSGAALALPPLQPRDEATLRALTLPILHLAAHMRSLAAYPLAVAEGLFARACGAACGAVRAVPASFRMTSGSGAAGGGGGGGGGTASGGGGTSSGRPLPRAPSPYVSSLLRPLKALLANGDLLPPTSHTTLALCAGVAIRTCGSYCDALGNTLEGLASLEASLQWLKKAPPTATGTSATNTNATAMGGLTSSAPPPAAALSDMERIGLQLALDVSALGRDLVDLPPLARVCAWDAMTHTIISREGGGEGDAAAAAVVDAFAKVSERVAAYAHLRSVSA